MSNHVSGASQNTGSTYQSMETCTNYMYDSQDFLHMGLTEVQVYYRGVQNSK